MGKNSIVRLYLWISIVFVLVIAVVNILFINDLPVQIELFPNGFFGTIEKTLFNIAFISESAVIEIFNLPMILHLVFLVLSIGVLAFALIGKALEQKVFVEVLLYNVIISLALVIGNAVFVYLIPDVVNGTLVNGLFITTMPKQAADVVNVYNLSFILLAFYFVLNGAMLIKTREQRVIKKEEFNEGELFL